MAHTDALRAELLAVARAFVSPDQTLETLLTQLASDVERAQRERLPIFPVMHHSPASAVQMVRYLREHRPRVVFIEMCEDLQQHLADLTGCQFPIALQAFSSKVVGHPQAWAPLSVLTPLTPFSAEVQAIAYALTTEGVELVFVDRPADMVFQWRSPEDNPDAPVFDEEEPNALHMPTGSVGVEVGQLAPTFGEFREVLLQHARLNHFEEWSNLYIEEPSIAAPVEVYREVMFFVGALFRRLGQDPHHREELRKRDRWMWTRIKQVLSARQMAPEEAVFLCGAAHSACDEVPEWGTDNTLLWDLPERTETQWQYGLVPSSYASIEQQFAHNRGALTLSESRWNKALKTFKIQPFDLNPAKAAKVPKGQAAPTRHSTQSILTAPPALSEADSDELIGWATGIVDLARKHRYLASTADSIAIYETSILLAHLRSRKRPSVYDFIDAAETCLEKGAPPHRKNIRELCERLLGGDKIGQVAYSSLPPLVQAIHDQLASVGVSEKSKRVTRVLLDFRAHPEYLPLSRLLWQLHWLTPGSKIARPIMGELKLGAKPKQESWDVAIHGREQFELIQLSYEGVSVLQVLEKRLKAQAFADDASTTKVLSAIEAAILLLDEANQLLEQLGKQAIHLFLQEKSPEDAPSIFRAIRELIQYYRLAGGLPAWLQQFVATGYAHYASLLPEAFRERHTSPEQLSAMLGFIFTLENLAVTMGCSRSQVIIALDQAQALTVDPEKLGLLWAAQWHVKRLSETELLTRFDQILQHPMGRSAYPRYLGGFFIALSFAPALTQHALGLLGRAFQQLEDRVLLPWLPSLLVTLKPRAQDVMPGMMRELTQLLPRKAADLATWSPPWTRENHVQTPVVPEPPPPAAPVLLSEPQAEASTLLASQPAATHAWAAALGLPPKEFAHTPQASPHLPLASTELSATPSESSDSGASSPLSELALSAASRLRASPEATTAWARALGQDAGWSLEREQAPADPTVSQPPPPSTPKVHTPAEHAASPPPTSAAPKAQTRVDVKDVGGASTLLQQHPCASEAWARHLA